MKNICDKDYMKWYHFYDDRPVEGIKKYSKSNENMQHGRIFKCTAINIII